MFAMSTPDCSLLYPIILHSVFSQQASLRFVQWNQSYGTCIPKVWEHGSQWLGLLFPTGRDYASRVGNPYWKSVPS